jgi:hypothetical protein
MLMGSGLGRPAQAPWPTNSAGDRTPHRADGRASALGAAPDVVGRGSVRDVADPPGGTVGGAPSIGAGTGRGRFGSTTILPNRTTACPNLITA